MIENLYALIEEQTNELKANLRSMEIARADIYDLKQSEAKLLEALVEVRKDLKISEDTLNGLIAAQRTATEAISTPLEKMCTAVDEFYQFVEAVNQEKEEATALLATAKAKSGDYNNNSPTVEETATLAAAYAADAAETPGDEDDKANRAVPTKTVKAPLGRKV